MYRTFDTYAFYISNRATVSENLLTFFIPTNFFSTTFFNDFTSLSDDLEKSRARSPEAQFIFSALN